MAASPPSRPAGTTPSTATERQDAAWFLRHRDEGYRSDDGSAAFFPLYPLAVRAVDGLPFVGPLGAALAVANLSFLGGTRDAVRPHAPRVRLRDDGAPSVLFLAIFPTAFFFLAPYTESTFLLLSVSAFWFARRDRWAWAALAAALAATTRNVGLLLAPALAVEA